MIDLLTNKKIGLIYTILFVAEMIFIVLDATNFGLEENGSIEETFVVYLYVKVCLSIFSLLCFVIPFIMFRRMKHTRLEDRLKQQKMLKIYKEERMISNMVVKMGYYISVLYFVGMV
jgi:hypothetical protein